MSVDTKEKRLSFLNLGLPWWNTLPETDGAIDADDRLHLLGLYSGISAVVVGGLFYVRADGTAAKADATGPTSNAAACMNLPTFNSSSFDAGDTVYFSDLGGDYDTVTAILPTSDVTYKNATGESPRFRLSTKVAIGATWTPSGSVYSTPIASITDPSGCWVSGTTILAKGSDADLSAGEFWPDTDNDLLYVRLADDSDPALVEIYLGLDDDSITAVNKTDITIDGITFRHGSHLSTRQGLWIYQCTDTTIKNCTFEYLSDSAIRFYKCSGVSTVEDCVFRYIWNGKPYGGGGNPGLIYFTTGGSPTGFVIQRNEVLECYLGIIPPTDILAPVEISYNIIEHCHVNALAGSGTAANKHTVIHNTVIHKPNPDVIPNNGHGIALRDNAGAIVKSNLFYFIENGVAGAELALLPDDDLEYIDIDYNCYWAETTPTMTFNFGGQNSNDLADMQAWLDTTSYLGKDANSFQVNPNFGTGYAPRHSSLQDAGHDGVTIGAVEYVASQEGAEVSLPLSRPHAVLLPSRAHAVLPESRTHCTILDDD